MILAAKNLVDGQRRAAAENQLLEKDQPGARGRKLQQAAAARQIKNPEAVRLPRVDGSRLTAGQGPSLRLVIRPMLSGNPCTAGVMLPLGSFALNVADSSRASRLAIQRVASPGKQLQSLRIRVRSSLKC